MNIEEVKFLIIRFSSIGDIVLTTPIIRGLKQQVKNSTVHYLTKPEYAPILSANPYIDKLHTLKSFGESIKELREEQFDYIIDLHKNLRTYRFKNKLRVLDFSFQKLNREKWLLVNFKINKLPEKHIVDRYYSTVHLFNVKKDNLGLDYFIPNEDKVNISEISTKLDKGFIAIGIGGHHNTKKLTAEKIVELCKKIRYPVVLLGGNEDIETGKFIKENCPKVHNLCGKYNINRSASIVEQSKLVITHDTGIMHIAAAFKKDIISIWGNTVTDFGMYPYQPGNNSQIFEVGGLSCRPCSKLGYKKCPKKHFKCMEDQDIDKIASAVKDILK